MSDPLINILIRNKYRPELFRRCIDSISEQGYRSIYIHIYNDSEQALKDCVEYMDRLGAFQVGGTVEIYRGNIENKSDHYWNLYCNQLKSSVKSGWFFFLDNDDYLRPGALKELSKHLTEDTDGIICQFERNGRPKPNDRLIGAGKIIRGHIGGGCLVLHSKHKDIANWDDQKAADYRWIKAVSEKVKLKYINLVLQVAGNNGLHGQ